jgi:salicylate hydroxylase
MRDSDARILIAGGGIGGLAAAVALADVGHHVSIFEQADQFREVGAGVQLGPNGVRALAAIGLEGQTDRWAWRPDALTLRDGLDGSLVTKIPLGDAFVQRFGARYGVIHRADLLQMLIEACQARTDRIHMDTRSRVVDFEVGSGGVEIVLTDGRRERGKALIGADGLRSVVRQRVVADGAPRPPRHVVYRGVVRRDQVPGDLWSSQVIMWSGPRADFVHYPLRSGELFNLVATFQSPVDLHAEDIAGRREDLDQAFAGFLPQVQRLLALLVTDRRWLVTDRAPAKGWSSGPVTLLGDAAHPMLQYMAQGACQALEDVVNLRDAVVRHAGDLPAAFGAYAQSRYLRTARVQYSARQMIEMCQADGVMAELRARYFAQRTSQAAYDSLAWLYSPHAHEHFA